MVVIIYCSIGYKDKPSITWYQSPCRAAKHNKNQNAPRPSEHPPVKGGKILKRLGGFTGYIYVVRSYEGTPIGAWVNSKMSGRSPPLYYPITATLIAMQGHQTDQRQKSR